MNEMSDKKFRLKLPEQHKGIYKNLEYTIKSEQRELGDLDSAFAIRMFTQDKIKVGAISGLVYCKSNHPRGEEGLVAEIADINIESRYLGEGEELAAVMIRELYKVVPDTGYVYIKLETDFGGEVLKRIFYDAGFQHIDLKYCDYEKEKVVTTLGKVPTVSAFKEETRQSPARKWFEIPKGKFPKEYQNG